jgi:hypothetical protein
MSLAKRNQAKSIDLERPHTCDFCQKSFVKESTLVTHSCEPKRRWQNQNQQEVKLGFAAWQMFHTSISPRSGTKAKKTYQEFCASSVYGAFVKFGSWCVENRAQEFECWVKWLLDHNIKIDAWCNTQQYQQYLADLLLSEKSEQAVGRGLGTINQWAQETRKPWTSFFQDVNINVAVRWIQEGRISGWLLFNAPSSEQFFLRCTPEQLTLIEKTLPIRKWKIMFLRHQQESLAIRDTLKESGL